MIENATGGLNEHPMHFSKWCRYISNNGYKHYCTSAYVYICCVFILHSS